jgi:release factor glutamine methyltransferase
MQLTVAPGVLIPRPETAVLVDLALEMYRREPELGLGDWVDLGTGSGAIPLALALECPDLHLHGVDCSPVALAIAQQNAHSFGIPHSLGIPHPVQWHLGSWFEPFAPWQGQGKFTVMVSNPPYIPTSDVAQLDPGLHHEPSLALDGGRDGLDALRHLVHQAPHYLRPGGLWLVEVMAGQAPIVQAELMATGQYRDIEIHQDDEGVERFVMAHLAFNYEL